MMKKTLIASAIAAAAMSGFGVTGNPILNVRQPDIDIEEEYELIKQKRSKLSANLRRWVVAQYEKKHG